MNQPRRTLSLAAREMHARLDNPIFRTPIPRQPTHPGLPDLCYVDVSSFYIEGVSVALLQRGVTGYRAVPLKDMKGATPVAYVDHMNTSIGVTAAQREAMFLGALIGWQIPGASPDAYNEDGTVKLKARRL
jgi:hypothetical protein